jgi:hypothetical protein
MRYVINSMSTIDGYLFRCKLCGEDHEVPEHLAPRWTGEHTLNNVGIGDIPLDCPNKPGVARYSVTDFVPYELTAS